MPPSLVTTALSLALTAQMPSQPSPAPTSPAANRQANHLAGQTSPYLLQHQFNPVDWRPWGPEAFAAARDRGVPIFLSVGYSTCYWCHVMERESFESPEIAAILNRDFVCVKVDREERPDVDDIYMAAVQVMTSRGGWPMSVWLTPPGARGPDDRGLEPFYAGTYFPAEPRHGMAAFPQILGGIAEAWRDQRGQVLEQAVRVTEAVREQLASASAAVHVGPEQIGQAVGALLRLYDRANGGFGPAPKFPQPVFLQFLMEVLPGIEDPAVAATARRAIRHTLDRMALGGMFDQVGGGYHRYSTDDRWLVPHFEKMLYDNAQLACLSARWMRDSGVEPDPLDERALRRTLDYVLREMTSPEGVFFSAQDAEVNHREGQNYLWTSAGLAAALGEDDGAFAAKVYGVDQGPNFRDPHHREDAPANVLFLADRPDALASRIGMQPPAFLARLDAINTRLLNARATRDQPITDDKVLAAWNGLMIAAFADAAVALHEPRYAEAAERAASFILAKMRGADGSLIRSWRDGRAGGPGFLEDYACVALGFIALHRANLALGRAGGGWVGHAAAVVQRALELFEDTRHPGRLCDTLDSQSDLIARTSGTYDGAMPAGASVLVHDLIDLHEITGVGHFLDSAARCLAALTPAIRSSPVGSINSTRALYRLLRADLHALERAGMPADAPDPGVVRVNEAPVQVFAGAERLTVGVGKPAQLTIELRIAEGFHITSAEPGVEGLVPLSVRVEGGQGVRVKAAFPKGEPYRGGALPPEEQGRLSVYTGTIRLTLTVDRLDEKWSGTPIIVLTYQACNDEACFQPISVELDVAIDPG